LKKIGLIFIVLLFFSKSYAAGHIDSNFMTEVFEYICEEDILFPEIVMKQAILETGWFRNKFLMNKNNLFAFKNQKYLKFNSWQECVEYYKAWQDKFYTNQNEDYYKFLIRIKYASPGYTALLKKVRFKVQTD
jgi:uncharacterized FlgJ-related protein